MNAISEVEKLDLVLPRTYITVQRTSIYIRYWLKARLEIYQREVQTHKLQTH